jgi:hypothetical protein
MLNCMKKIDAKLVKREHKYLDLCRVVEKQQQGFPLQERKKLSRSTFSLFTNFKTPPANRHLMRPSSPIRMRLGVLQSSLSLDIAETTAATPVSSDDRYESIKQDYYQIHKLLLSDLPTFIQISAELMEWTSFIFIQAENGFRSFMTDIIADPSSLTQNAPEEATGELMDALVDGSRRREAIKFTLAGETHAPLDSLLKSIKQKCEKALEGLFPMYEEFILVKNNLRPPVPDYSSSLSPSFSTEFIQPSGFYAAKNRSEESMYPSIPSTFSPSDPREKLPAASFVKALYSYEGQMHSDLTFQQGDYIEVLSKTPFRADWWLGRMACKIGSFPANYTQDSHAPAQL